MLALFLYSSVSKIKKLKKKKERKSHLSHLGEPLALSHRKEVSQGRAAVGLLESQRKGGLVDRFGG